MNPAQRRFACTACGACCDRPPELELGESLAHAGHFVLHLLLRPYVQPRRLEDWRRTLGAGRDGAAQQDWLAQKRLLAEQAVLSFASRGAWQGKAFDCTTFVTATALALDLTPGRCHRRDDKLCSIHAERPLACRTVPFHYSRVEPFPLAEFDAFTAAPGYSCDSGPEAPLALDAGRVVAPGYAAARAAAAERMEADKPWRTALAAAIAAGNLALPGRRAIEANAARGASAVPLIAAWRIAAEAALIEPDVLADAAARQLALVRAELARAVQNGNAALAEELRGLALGLGAATT